MSTAALTAKMYLYLFITGAWIIVGFVGAAIVSDKTGSFMMDIGLMVLSTVIWWFVIGRSFRAGINELSALRHRRITKNRMELDEAERMMQLDIIEELRQEREERYGEERR